MGNKAQMPELSDDPYVQVTILQGKIISHLGQRVLGLIVWSWGNGNKLFVWVLRTALRSGPVFCLVSQESSQGIIPHWAQELKHNRSRCCPQPATGPASVTIGQGRLSSGASAVADCWGKLQDQDEHRHGKRDDSYSKTLKLNVIQVIRTLGFQY